MSFSSLPLLYPSAAACTTQQNLISSSSSSGSCFMMMFVFMYQSNFYVILISFIPQVDVVAAVTLPG